MKLIYSHLQKFLPDLKVEPQKLRDDLTMIEHFTNYFEEIDGEIVFDLDIKVNRGDCLGYYGIARDLAVLYNIPLKNLSIVETHHDASLPTLPIIVTTNNVKRVMVAKLSGLKNNQSPKWLETFIKCHGTKPVNLIVDLTNYIMFMYGIPNHAFDIRKSGENLIWQMNPGFKVFISLDGSNFKLTPEILMINNLKKALSLSFWGGEACAIDNNSTDIILEMAIYNPTTIRQNSRDLKAFTEAGTRLEKYLDPKTIPLAFNTLISLLLDNCQGQVASQIFDYYPKKVNLPQIKFNLDKPSQVSGINIPKDFIIDCFTRLGCTISSNIQNLPSNISIIPPSIRTDINIEADLIEEAVRFWGYDKIPTNQPLDFKQITDITPKENYLIEELKDKLVEIGYDEVITWPLVTSPTNSKTVIKTQNSINSEAIYLRQSLIPSLQQQLDQYSRYKLTDCQFFEIGKIFSKVGDKYIEKTALGIYNFNPQQLLFDIEKLNLKTKLIQNNFIEIILDDLPKPEKYIPQTTTNNAHELTSQIITLDANITLDKQENPISLIKKYSQIIDNKYLWQIFITDIYHDLKTNKYRYTFRVSYFNTDDKTAKKIHLKTFGLE
jgi:phenylalanyl-tRNA synthetase beta chain